MTARISLIPVLLAWLWITSTSIAADADRLFREKVGPVLARSCGSCHSGDSPKGKLSLESREALLQGGVSGVVVELNDPDSSLLLEQVSGDAPNMPPKGDRLTPSQVDDLRQWIAAGAPWPDDLSLADLRAVGDTWWAFQPLKRPRLPDMAKPRDSINPIDRFVHARLAQASLSSSVEADRRTLIRRLSFDLLGLPPAPAEIADFLADTRPDSYERLVDHYLASPRYGERWGRHWLDVARYADTHGFDKDKRRNNAWPYRDYVVEALNGDLPYDRFIQEQIAGDILAPDDPSSVVATGFLVAGPWDFVGQVELREGTVEKAKTRVLDRDDYVSATIGVFQSLTVHCARCHDHKFDPIPQRDYYALQAVFSGIDRGDRSIEQPEIAAERRRLAAELARLEGQRKQLLADWTVRRDAVIDKLDASISRLAEQSIRPSANPPSGSPTNGYHGAISPNPEAAQWVQLDLGRSVPLDAIDLIPARPTDFADTPGFGFPVRYRVEISDQADFSASRMLVDHSSADQPNPGDSMVRVDGGGASGRYIRVTATRLWPHSSDYVFALAELLAWSGSRNVAAGASASASSSIDAGRWNVRHLVDGHDSRHALPDWNHPENIASWNDYANAIRNRLDLETRRDAHRSSLISTEERETAERLQGQIADLKGKVAALPPAQPFYGLLPISPRPIHILRRGEVEQPAQPASPGPLACVASASTAWNLESAASDSEGPRRLALARWLSSPSNPLTWRSMANRIWLYHFGVGLVDTPNDFGRNGSQPSHPELLDWIASELRDSRSLKRIQRLIVTSATYRQSSAPRPDAAAIDADNRLLARMNRTRLDAESIRDAVLATSGALDLRMGGPGVELFRFKDDHSPTYDHLDPAKAIDPTLARRTVYRFVVRSVANPFLECFDAVDPNQSAPMRATTVTPLQALALLNDPFMTHQSRLLSKRIESEATSLDARIDRLFWLAFGRAPLDDEKSALSVYAQRHGLTAACRLVLNANEFLFVD